MDDDVVWTYADERALFRHMGLFMYFYPNGRSPRIVVAVELLGRFLFWWA
jgi:hypothetical protein